MNMDETGLPSLSSQISDTLGSGQAEGTVTAKAAAAALFNTKKYREEYENAKSRLIDQKFRICELLPPLLHYLSIKTETEQPNIPTH
jgi:hypothetical protein